MIHWHKLDDGEADLKKRVISLIRPVNIPSQRVALRVGMKPEKLTKFRDFDHLVFALGRLLAGVEA